MCTQCSKLGVAQLPKTTKIFFLINFLRWKKIHEILGRLFKVWNSVCIKHFNGFFRSFQPFWSFVSIVLFICFKCFYDRFFGFNHFIVSLVSIVSTWFVLTLVSIVFGFALDPQNRFTDVTKNVLALLCLFICILKWSWWMKLHTLKAREGSSISFGTVKKHNDDKNKTTINVMLFI